MPLRRAFGADRIRDAKRQSAGLDLSPQSLEFLELTVVGPTPVGLTVMLRLPSPSGDVAVANCDSAATPKVATTSSRPRSIHSEDSISW